MRAKNFGAGPAGLPLPALEQAKEELLDFKGSGASVMELSHRGKEYDAVHQEALALFKELLSVPDSHDVLLLQGGASLQFAMVPMNFLLPGSSADYVLTGVWAEKAYEEAGRVGRVKVAASTKVEDKGYLRVPRADELKVDPEARYVHITSNNTIYGTQYFDFPDVGAPRLVADMSSDFLWRPIDVSKFGLIYAGAQKNLGPSGVVVVVAEKELMASARRDIPKILRYQTHAEAGSLYNTPPSFGIYLVRNVLQWVKAEGGLAGMEKRNRTKAELLYGAIDRMGGFYTCPVERQSRSVMNVVFRLPNASLDEQFVKEAQKEKMIGLKGYRSVGGIRASTYNAVSVEDVQALVSFMEQFAQKNG